MRLIAIAVLLLTPGSISAQERIDDRRPFTALSASAQRLKESALSRAGKLVAGNAVEVQDPALLELDEQLVRDSVLSIARRQIGRRYVLGGTTPGRGFDCSGLVRFVLAALRLGVPRTADEQSRIGLAVVPDTGELRPGDLVTFGSGRRVKHIGIYSGEGRFIHASVKAGRVIESSITRRTSPLVRNWRGARRLLAVGDSTTASEPVLGARRSR
ncbi:MAG: C40 family peptidase [Gemmatimonadaceae bacterium]